MSITSSFGKQIHSTLDRFLRRIESAALAVAGCLLLIVMVLVAMDAVLRYAFNTPLTFQYYLTENYLMVGMLALGLAWGFRTGGYIRIQALLLAVPKGVRNVMLRAGLLVSSAYVAALAWLAGTYFLEAYRAHQVSIGVIDWPVAWSWATIPVGCGLLAVRLLLTAFGPPEELNVEHDPAEEAL